MAEKKYRKYWQMKAKADRTAEILIYEQIGEDFFSEGIGARQFADDLKALGDLEKIVLRINSPGGSVFEGLAIYNQLRIHKATKEVHIDGLAASIASVIAMAGQRIIMPENALMMIHDPFGFVMGDAEDMRKMAEALDKIKDGIISAYRTKSSLENDEIASLMEEETWMSAQDAMDRGFADEVEEAVKMAANFDLSRFKNAPLNLVRDITKMAVQDSAQKEAEMPELCEKCGSTLVDGKCRPCETKAQAAKAEAMRSEAADAERKRVSDILALGESHGCRDLAQKAVSNGLPLDQFKDMVLKRVYDAQQLEPIRPEIGMSDAEADEFSIVRAIKLHAENKPLDGLEREASEAVARRCGRQPKGFFIPHDVMSRKMKLSAIKNALSEGSSASGGYLVGTDVLVADMIELLRNKILVAQLGARQLDGLVGNIAIPRVTGGATAYWLPETGEVTASSQTFGQLGLTPKRLVGDTAYSKELIAQTSLDVEAFVREDLMRVLAIARDLAAINGSGASGQPVGILNTTGIGSVTFSAAATWAKVVSFETTVATANADSGPMAYLTTPATRGKWKTITKIASSQYSDFLWEGGVQGSGMVNGYRAEATLQVPTNKVIFGNWADLLLATWAGIDVIVDPFSLKKTGQIEITITILCDNGIRHAGSFCASTDSGAQ